MRHLQLISRRAITTIPLVFLVTIVIFSITYLVPGDPAATIAGESASAADIERIRGELGLDEPLVTQYLSWLGGVVQGDLGSSLHNGRDVSSIIAARIPATLSLTLAALVIAVLIGIPQGILAATRPYSLRDRASVVSASVSVALPNYWLGLLLVTVLAVQLRWFPATGYVGISEDPVTWLRHITLPALALGIAASGEVTRQTRAAFMRVLELDYVRTARMKGLKPSVVMGKHVLKNAAGPIVTTIGLTATVLLGGAVVVERVFGIAGLGNTALIAVSGRDIPVIQGIALVAALITVAVNLCVDLVASYLNPKVEML